jgi:hypothetical protein
MDGEKQQVPFDFAQGRLSNALHSGSTAGRDGRDDKKGASSAVVSHSSQKRLEWGTQPSLRHLVIELEGELYQSRIAGLGYLIIGAAGRGVIGLVE